MPPVAKFGASKIIHVRMNAAAQLVDHLRAAILPNTLPPETRLPEAEMAQPYGVSRQPAPRMPGPR